jgi:hypothetical protein
MIICIVALLGAPPATGLYAMVLREFLDLLDQDSLVLELAVQL